MDVKTAIREGDRDALRHLLIEDQSRADALIRWGHNDRLRTHPLHYISDMLFEGILKNGSELSLVDALIEAGADLDFQRDGKGDTPLIGAASLGAEDVGAQAGCRRELGRNYAESLVKRLCTGRRFSVRIAWWRALIGGSDLNLRDEKYESPPLGWAFHGCSRIHRPEIAANIVRSSRSWSPRARKSNHNGSNPRRFRVTRRCLLRFGLEGY